MSDQNKSTDLEQALDDRLAATAMAACKGAPATIQPGAAVKMADALEEYEACQRLENSGMRADWKSAHQQARAALAAFYGVSE